MFLSHPFSQTNRDKPNQNNIKLNGLNTIVSIVVI